MGYANFVEITIHNSSSSIIKFQNAAHEWGKFYTDSKKDNELSPHDLNKKTIPAKSDYILGACGRENASSGCQGTFELYTEDGVKVAHIAYMSPYNGTPYFTVDAPSMGSGWIASASGANTTTGPLGEVKLTIAHIE